MKGKIYHWIAIIVLAVASASLFIYARVQNGFAREAARLVAEQRALAERNAEEAEQQRVLAIESAVEAERQKNKVRDLQEKLDQCEGK